MNLLLHSIILCWFLQSFLRTSQVKPPVSLVTTAFIGLDLESYLMITGSPGSSLGKPVFTLRFNFWSSSRLCMDFLRLSTSGSGVLDTPAIDGCLLKIDWKGL